MHLHECKNLKFTVTHPSGIWCELCLRAWPQYTGSSKAWMDIYTIPYSRKVWLEESLANHERFAKLKSSKYLLTIITFWLNLFIRQTFFAKCSKRVNSPNFTPRQQTFLLYGNIFTLSKRIFTTFRRVLSVWSYLGIRRFCQQNYWSNRNTKATRKMLA